MIRLATVAAAVALVASPAVAATQLVDGGFEDQAAAVGSFCYFSQATCPAGAWTGTQAGLQFEGNSAWPGALTEDGRAYGFIQSTGEISQTFTANDDGIFSLSWLDAGRPQGGFFNGDQNYEVRLGTQVLGTFSTQSFQPFTARGAGGLALHAGQNYTLTFRGLNSTDNTAFIDAVSLSFVGDLPPPMGGVPEPGAWALMILGFGSAGAALRLRRRTGPAAA